MNEEKEERILKHRRRCKGLKTPARRKHATRPLRPQAAAVVASWVGGGGGREDAIMNPRTSAIGIAAAMAGEVLHDLLRRSTRSRKRRRNRRLTAQEKGERLVRASRMSGGILE